jgi:hypothetical protein
VKKNNNFNSMPLKKYTTEEKAQNINISIVKILNSVNHTNTQKAQIWYKLKKAKETILKYKL